MLALEQSAESDPNIVEVLIYYICPTAPTPLAGPVW